MAHLPTAVSTCTCRLIFCDKSQQCGLTVSPAVTVLNPQTALPHLQAMMAVLASTSAAACNKRLGKLVTRGYLLTPPHAAWHVVSCNHLESLLLLLLRGCRSTYVEHHMAGDKCCSHSRYETTRCLCDAINLPLGPQQLLLPLVAAAAASMQDQVCRAPHGR